MEAPLLDSQIYQPYKNEGVIVVALGLYSSMAPAINWQKTYDLAYLIGIDINSEVWNEYGTGFIPHNIVIGQSMNVLYSDAGAYVDTIESWINTELNKAPSPPTGLATTPVEPISLAISWDQNIEKDVAGYELSYSEIVNSGNKVTIDVGNVTNYYLDNLALHTTYEFTLKAYDMRGNYSISSTPVEGTTVGDVPELSFWGILCLLLVLSGLFFVNKRKGILAAQ